MKQRVEFVYDAGVKRDCCVQRRPIQQAFYLHGHRCENLKFSQLHFLHIMLYCNQQSTQCIYYGHTESCQKNIKRCSRYRPGVAQRVGRGRALLFHDRGTATEMYLIEDYYILGYHTESSGNSLPMFRDKLSVPSSRVKNILGFLTTGDGNDALPETSIRIHRC